MSIHIPVSIGELWDKYTILLIKQDKIKNEVKLKHVILEIKCLDEFMNKFSYKEHNLFLSLKNVNEILWDIEDKLRIKEQNRIFDNEFIELSRSVYTTNDKRCELKTQINVIFNSLIYEVKDYVNYS